MTRLLRILIWPAAFVLALALTFGVASALGQEKPAKPPNFSVIQYGPVEASYPAIERAPTEPPKTEAPKPKIVPLSTEQILEQALLEQQAENLRLRVCAKARIDPDVCEVRWRDRVVVDVSTLPKPEQPKEH